MRLLNEDVELGDWHYSFDNLVFIKIK